jgi:lipid-binding SYLF domain-containing protein
MRRLLTGLSCILFVVAGSTIRSDNGDNTRVYGKEIAAQKIVLSRRVAVPPSAQLLVSTSAAKTAKHRP